MTYRRIVALPDYPWYPAEELLNCRKGLHRVVYNTLVAVLDPHQHTTHLPYRNTPTTQTSLNADSRSSEITSSAMGMNCRSYDEMLTSPSTPSSSRMLETSVEARGTRRRV